MNRILVLTVLALTIDRSLPSSAAAPIGRFTAAIQFGTMRALKCSRRAVQNVNLLALSRRSFVQDFLWVVLAHSASRHNGNRFVCVCVAFVSVC